MMENLGYNYKKRRKEGQDGRVEHIDKGRRGNQKAEEEKGKESHTTDTANMLEIIR